VTSLKVVGFGVALVLALPVTLLLGIGLAPALVICTLAAVVGYSAPNMYLYQRAYERTDQLQKSLPDALDLLTISVESGLGFDAALAQVARNTDGALADELARVLQEMQIGMGRGAALRALGDRTKVDDVKGFVSAMVQADALGIPIAQVLRVQSREIRTKRRQRAEEKAQKVAIKILIPLIFCILPCLFIAVLGPAGLAMVDAFRGRL
jgi:tight adherence protein C